IAVNGLSKSYATRDGAVVALDRTTFSVAEGEFVSVVGPSGCGKSTLLKILAGILPASGGEARLRSTVIAGPRRDIGIVFQSPVPFPWRTVLDNVLLPIDVQRLGRERHTDLGRDLLRLVGLDCSCSTSACCRSLHRRTVWPPTRRPPSRSRTSGRRPGRACASGSSPTSCRSSSS